MRTKTKIAGAVHGNSAAARGRSPAVQALLSAWVCAGCVAPSGSGGGGGVFAADGPVDAATAWTDSAADLPDVSQNADLVAVGADLGAALADVQDAAMASDGSPPGADADAGKPLITCTSDKQCSAQSMVCHVSTQKCVDCLVDKDCSADLTCKLFACVPKPKPCQTSKDCPLQLCDKASSLCVDCLASIDCAAAQYCKAKACVQDVCTASAKVCVGPTIWGICNTEGSGIATQSACPIGKQCAEGACVGDVPKLELKPGTLTFPWVVPQQCGSQIFHVTNAGDGVLTVSAVDLATVDPSIGVKLSFPADLDTNWHTGGTKWQLPTPLEIAPQGSAEFEVKFCPVDATKKAGKIQFVSNAFNPPQLQISANTAPPCIKVWPATHNFGANVPGAAPGKMMVSVQNCGGVDLVVTGIDFVPAETNSTEFKIDLNALFLKGKLAAPPPLGVTNPLVVAVGKAEEVAVSYAAADITKEGLPPDKATIEFISNATIGAKVTVSGVGVAQMCPQAKAAVTEGDLVIPQTTLHLVGAKSVAVSGSSVTKFSWTVKQPIGSVQQLLPDAKFANPTFLANVAGEYQFCLEVWDKAGTKSCTQSCQKVLVVPTAGLHVELLWDTPTDANQGDTGPAAGADLDLHFANPFAQGPDLDCDGKADPWFSNPWDTFWYNAAPEWGDAVAKDNPTLDLDDTDGAGPELLNLVQPEGTVSAPMVYTVGVYYWKDYGFGQSFATVSFWVMGTLVGQVSKTKLDPLDMWHVGKINWPNTATGGAKKIVEFCYQSGLSCPAAKNLMWQAQGNPCITPCYVNKAFVGAVGAGAVKTPKCP